VQIIPLVISSMLFKCNFGIGIGIGIEPIRIVVIFDPDSDPDGFLPVKNPIELMTLS
jgi:hypothetical protein